MGPGLRTVRTSHRARFVSGSNTSPGVPSVFLSVTFTLTLLIAINEMLASFAVIYFVGLVLGFATVSSLPPIIALPAQMSKKITIIAARVIPPRKIKMGEIDGP